jgi:hypothetical protein
LNPKKALKRKLLKIKRRASNIIMAKSMQRDIYKIK